MSNWQNYEFEARIIAILNEVEYRTNPAHHFGTPYLTAYQLAIEFDARHPEVARDLGYQIGGAGIGERVSLAQYIAGQLSRRIRDNTLQQIEGAFLADVHLISLVFRQADQEIISSLTGSGYDLSMFRIRNA